MYFLYGGCHGHPPALLCSRCRRQYCSPANAWGIARPPVRRSKPRKPKTTPATTPKGTSQLPTNKTGSKTQQGFVTTLQRGDNTKTGSTVTKCTSRTSSSQQLIPNQKVGQTTPGVRTELAKPSSGKSFAEKLRSLLSCVA